ncbi:MAG: hypothetical protein GOV00_00605 [Candidatus Altiarchaeota archaeon]|nr:hypothetical protein [Candidatus Altiarchaeota archaeon]
MEKSRISTLVLTFFLFATIGYAADLDVILSDTSLSFDYGEAVNAHLNITNNDGNRVELLVDAEGIPTWLNIFPSSIQLNPGATETVWLRFSPSMPLTKYLYLIDVSAKEGGVWVSQWKNNVVVTVTGDGPAAVTPSNRFIGIETLEEIMPGTTLQINIEVKPAVVPSTLDLIILMGDKVAQTVSTELEATTVTVEMEIPKTLAPGEYTLKASLVGKGIINSTKITILENAQASSDIKKESKFLGSKTFVYVINTGNVDKIARYYLQLPIYQKLIFSADPEPEVLTVDGVPMMSWAYRVAPGESQLVVSYSIDYTPYGLLVLLIVLAGVLILQKPEPISTIKKIEETREVDGKTVIKVLIKIVNRSDKSAEDVMVEDVVPGIAVPSKFQVIKPKAKKTKAGFVLTWNLGRMEPYEERLFGYEMILGFGLIGELKLPQPKVSAKL